jgi:hypothetical protein
MAVGAVTDKVATDEFVIPHCVETITLYLLLFKLAATEAIV